jgi:hypothetical protein
MNTKPISWFKDGSCFHCTSHINTSKRCGYPRFKRNKRFINIARAILIRRHGELPEGIVARHTCDNVWCINPDHIIPGTRYDNVQDRVTRGRNGAAFGENNGRHKLTEIKVIEIKKSPKRYSDLASEFGVSVSTIWRIKTNRNWVKVV